MATDRPCECERGALRLDLVRVIHQWKAAEGLQYDWRKSFDLLEAVDGFLSAMDWGQCGACAAETKYHEQVDSWGDR